MTLRTVAAMAAAFGTEAVAESYYREQVDDILKHHNGGRWRQQGYFLPNFWNTRPVRPWHLVQQHGKLLLSSNLPHGGRKIMPKIWVVAKLTLRSPQTAIHWGSYPMKVCDDTKSLCMQFESVVTNSTLSFSDTFF